MALDRHTSRTVIEQFTRQYEETGKDGVVERVVHPT
jgi:hypothetical protein